MFVQLLKSPFSLIDVSLIFFRKTLLILKENEENGILFEKCISMQKNVHFVMNGHLEMNLYIYCKINEVTSLL